MDVQFPPLTAHRHYLLEEIEFSLNELKVFNGSGPLSPDHPDLVRIEQIQHTLNDLSTKALLLAGIGKQG